MTTSIQRPDDSFARHFGILVDPRIDRHKQYPLVEILFLSLCAVVCGCSGPTEIADFGSDRLDWLRGYHPYENGTPSHDTIRRVLGLIKPDAFEAAFLGWIGEFFPESIAATAEASRQIAIDGKALRATAHRARELAALQIVTAWSTTHQVMLAQQMVSQKSNEITALPLLLGMLELRGAIVSIDAMGCQTQVATTIIDGGGEYLLHLKGNQPTLQSAVIQAFDQFHDREVFAEDPSTLQTSERGHGREEQRTYHVIDPSPELLREHQAWTGLRSIAQVCSVVQREGREHVETRYYISSLDPHQVARIATVIRDHWQIENGLHWVLDVVFSEDATRMYDRILSQNLAIIRRIAVSLLKKEPSNKSLIQKQRSANRNTNTLKSILFGPD